ncbi:Hepatic leukemia factor [Portunus trituberculatus]|uniref:Hepatic leukemia factor n=1 Tax=Portunus trituberculatus TaxID=210409 RepID=A0A5B7GI32_PORTR|nr:Hepatic leukemia factor [Portunus trituberculatus]
MRKDNTQAKRVTRRRSGRVAASLPLRLRLISSLLYFLVFHFVPAELKDDKYWARRRKNNLAAKRSRDARRLKENQIAMRANFLEKEVREKEREF